MTLEGKAAIVTGGGVSVGRAVALDLAKRGASVAVNYSRSATDAERTAADCERLGVRALSVKADVRDDDAVRAMTEEAVAAFGRLDILVNNAGVTRFIDHAELEKVGRDDWDFIFDTNVWGTFVGVAILAVGISGIQQFGGSFWVEPMFNGVTLLIAIGIAGYAQRRKGAAKK